MRVMPADYSAATQAGRAEKHIAQRKQPKTQAKAVKLEKSRARTHYKSASPKVRCDSEQEQHMTDRLKTSELKQQHARERAHYSRKTAFIERR